MEGAVEILVGLEGEGELEPFGGLHEEDPFGGEEEEDPFGGEEEDDPFGDDDFGLGDLFFLEEEDEEEEDPFGDDDDFGLGDLFFLEEELEVVDVAVDAVGVGVLRRVPVEGELPRYYPNRPDMPDPRAIDIQVDIQVVQPRALAAGGDLGQGGVVVGENVEEEEDDELREARLRGAAGDLNFMAFAGQPVPGGWWFYAIMLGIYVLAVVLFLWLHTVVFYRGFVQPDFPTATALTPFAPAICYPWEHPDAQLPYISGATNTEIFSVEKTSPEPPRTSLMIPSAGGFPDPIHVWGMAGNQAFLRCFTNLHRKALSTCFPWGDAQGGAERCLYFAVLKAMETCSENV